MAFYIQVEIQIVVNFIGDSFPRYPKALGVLVCERFQPAAVGEGANRRDDAKAWVAYHMWFQLSSGVSS